MTLDTVNGWNGTGIVTDFYGRQVDAFGTRLKDSDKTTYTYAVQDTDNDQVHYFCFESSTLKGYKISAKGN